MKKLQPQDFDDYQITTDLSENDRLHKTSYPYLADTLDLILENYQRYEDLQGNALNINPIGIAKNLKIGLIKNYKKPPNMLSHIAELRKSSPDVCPMCGSLKTATLDHLLPKDDYPEFSIYSKNLIPACDCNSKRKNALKDENLDARILHPYFDDCLSERLVSCKILGVPDFKKARLELIFLKEDDELISSIKYHVSKIVIPSGINGWLDSQWATLVEYPPNVIHTLPHIKVDDAADMAVFLGDALHRNDKRYGTPNNWESIFVHGLLESEGVLEWLMLRHNQII